MQAGRRWARATTTLATAAAVSQCWSVSISSQPCPSTPPSATAWLMATPDVPPATGRQGRADRSRGVHGPADVGARVDTGDHEIEARAERPQPGEHDAQRRRSGDGPRLVDAVDRRVMDFRLQEVERPEAGAHPRYSRSGAATTTSPWARMARASTCRPSESIPSSFVTRMRTTRAALALDAATATAPSGPCRGRAGRTLGGRGH